MSASTLPVIELLLQGDRKTISRTISALENGSPQAAVVRAALSTHVGRAHVIGVTGPPGGGKSTLVSALIKGIRRRGLRVAVVAVDPSSPFSGGAVLGDRVRMGEHQDDEGVFIRSLASRGQTGGLSVATSDVIDVFDAAAYPVIIVETVGAGQSEVAIVGIADTKLVICPPGLGDDVQAIKAGMLEIADAYAVTKADLPDARRTESDLQAMLKLRRVSGDSPPVFLTQATSNIGTDEVVEWLLKRSVRGTRLGSPEDRRARHFVSEAVANDPFMQSLGIQVVSVSQKRVTLRMVIKPEQLNFNGTPHGGALFSLADSALGLAANAGGRVAALIDGNLSLSAAVRAGDAVLVHAEEINSGRTLCVHRVLITRESDGRHVGQLTGTCYVRGEHPRPS